MIYDILKPCNPLVKGSIILRPVNEVDAWNCYHMIDQAFPYNGKTLFNFSICCANGTIFYAKISGFKFEMVQILDPDGVIICAVMAVEAAEILLSHLNRG